MKKPLLASAFLFAALFGCAATPATASPAPEQRARAAHVPYSISIRFTRTHHGKMVTDKTYVLMATTGEQPPALRDDTKYRTDANNPALTIDGNTDIDILALRPGARTVYVGLRVSMNTIGSSTTEGLPRLPAAGIHQYVLTPTIPLGQTVTVYTASDATHETVTEVRLRVERCRPEAANQPLNPIH